MNIRAAALAFGCVGLLARAQPADRWRDPDQPLPVRVGDLIGRMTLAEKVSQLRNETPGIPRLGIPAYDYWSEALHGVARDDIATVFPQAIGMAAAWDPALVQDEGDVIATEGRAKFNEETKRRPDAGRARYHGLTYWSPNVNIFRDPRWGRGQETYGEDPLLTGTLAVAFIHGLQGDDSRYLKAMACAKHFAVHSGPELLRHRFDAWPPQRDLYETYLPQFEMAVKEGKVGGVMGAYNALFGVPACASPLLLEDILRGRWRFRGYIVSDCGAITNIYAEHHFVSTRALAATVAIKAGCDLCCGEDYDALVQAVKSGLIPEVEIDDALAYALQARFRLGLFDPPDRVPFSRIGIDQNDTPEHEALARRVAEESLVLLRNDGTLPLDRGRIRRIAVIGANADSVPVLIGNYEGTPARPVTILRGIRAAAGPRITVTYAPGCPLALRRDGSNRPSAAMTAQALADARAADVVIYVGGISAAFEGEENRRADAYPGFEGGDRTRIELPAVQTQLLQALQATGRPVIFVSCSGSALAMPWEAAHLPAILQAWYPGEQGGTAVGAALFGAINPSGRLPVTFYASTADLPPFADYSMRNRTYRYFAGKPLFPFGHGLSYTRFAYVPDPVAAVDFPIGDVPVALTVANRGGRDGAEVVQVYVRHLDPLLPQARESLAAFTRVAIPAGQSRHVALRVPAAAFRYWDPATEDYRIEAGRYELLVGASSADIRVRVPIRLYRPGRRPIAADQAFTSKPASATPGPSAKGRFTSMPLLASSP